MPRTHGHTAARNRILGKRVAGKGAHREGEGCMSISSNDTIRKNRGATRQDTLTWMHKSNLITALAGEYGTKGEFTSQEYSTLYRWLYEMDLPYDEVEFAMAYCAYVQGKAGFGYINTVLTKWKNAGITSKAEAMKHTCRNAGQPQEGRDAHKKAAAPAQQPIRFGSLYIPASGPVAAVTEEPDGTVALHVHGMDGKYVLEKGITFDRAISIVDGGAPAIQKESVPAEEGEQAGGAHVKLREAYERLLNAGWAKVPVSNGTDGQNRYANGVRDGIVKHVLGKCREILDAGAPDAVTEEGLTAAAVAAMAGFIDSYFGTVADFQKIIDDYAKNTGVLSHDGLARYGREHA